ITDGRSGYIAASSDGWVLYSDQNSINKLRRVFDHPTAIGNSLIFGRGNGDIYDIQLKHPNGSYIGNSEIIVIDPRTRQEVETSQSFNVNEYEFASAVNCPDLIGLACNLGNIRKIKT